MERKQFIKSAMRWGLLGILALISVLLAARVTTKPDCQACPTAAGCTSKDKCPL